MKQLAIFFLWIAGVMAFLGLMGLVSKAVRAML
jgi:hypothetical protein